MKNEKEKKPERKTTFGQALFVIIVMFVVLLGGTKLGLNYRLLMVAVAIFAGAMNVFVLHISWEDCAACNHHEDEWCYHHLMQYVVNRLSDLSHDDLRLCADGHLLRL